MATLTTEEEAQKIKSWQNLGYKHEHREAEGAFKAFTAAITEHRNKGHHGMSTFWDFKCACGFEATLTIWSGEPFITNGRGRFATVLKDGEEKRLITEDYPY